MTTADMKISTEYGESVIRVEVVASLGHGRVRVRALQGEPFTQTSHGGPMRTNVASVFLANLTNKHDLISLPREVEPVSLG